MVSKKKKCSGCGEDCYIWKSDKKEKFCKSCWYKQSPPTAIKPVSDKKKVEDKEYFILREQYLGLHSSCEAKLEGCTLTSQEIHHLYFGSDRSKHYTDFENVKAVCRSCHRFIHDKLSTEDAVELGLRILDSADL